MRRTLVALALSVGIGCSGGESSPAIDGPLVEIALRGVGVVTSDPEGIECGSTCSSRFLPNTRVELSASAPAGGRFLGWSGACAGTERCVVTVDRDLLIGANFGKADAALELLVQGSGTIESSAAGISCADRCDVPLAIGAVIELVAVPAPGFRFAGWSGACSGSDMCTVAMEGATSVLAVFVAEPILVATVDIEVSGPGSVLFNGLACRDFCSFEVPLGAHLEMAAVPDDSAVFSGWGAACSGSNPICAFDVRRDRRVTATFTAIASFPLTVYQEGTGIGLVYSVDGAIECGPICTASFEEGTIIELIATANEGSTFDGWLDCPEEQLDMSCTIEAGAVPSVTALFSSPDSLLEVFVEGPGSVISNPAGIDCPGVSCAGTFFPGTIVTLTPIANLEAAFWRWEGDCTGSDPLGCVLDMSVPRTVTARFGSTCDLWSIVTAQGGGAEAAYDPIMDTPNAITVEAWVETVPLSWGDIASRVDQAAGECSFSLRMTQGQLEWCVFSGCTGPTPDSRCIITPFTDVIPRWRHVAAVFSAPSTLSLFIDGQPPNNVMQSATGNFAGTLGTNTLPIRSSLRTALASLRIASYARYALPFVPERVPRPLEGDIFDWLIEEGTGSVLYDASLNAIDGVLTGARWTSTGPGCD